MKAKVWKHKKYKGEFIGRYSRYTVMKKDKTFVGERTFILVPVKGKMKPKSYESHEAAKKDGWTNK